jgi:hypothetical protein
MTSMHSVTIGAGQIVVIGLDYGLQVESRCSIPPARRPAFSLVHPFCPCLPPPPPPSQRSQNGPYIFIGLKAIPLPTPSPSPGPSHKPKAASRAALGVGVGVGVAVAVVGAAGVALWYRRRGMQSGQGSGKSQPPMDVYEKVEDGHGHHRAAHDTKHHTYSANNAFA